MSKFQQPEGFNFATPDDIAGIDLARILQKVAAYLQSCSPYAKRQRYDDWWEHDGLHFYKNAFSFDELFEIVHSPKNLLAAMPGDFCVFVGVYSSEIPFYLRFYVDWDEAETAIVGRFDVTIPDQLVDRFRSEIVNVSNITFEENRSLEYYRSIIE